MKAATSKSPSSRSTATVKLYMSVERFVRGRKRSCVERHIVELIQVDLDCRRLSGSSRFDFARGAARDKSCCCLAARDSLLASASACDYM